MATFIFSYYKGNDYYSYFKNFGDKDVALGQILVPI